MKKLLAVTLLSTVLATPSHAEDSPIYAGVLLGDSYVGILGGYQIDKMFSAEVHYATVLQSDVTSPAGTVKADTYLIGANLVALLPWKVQQVPEITFFAQGGMDYVSNKVTTSAAGNSITVSTRETKLSLGGGAQYDLNKSFSARAGIDLLGYRNDLYFSGIFRF